MATHFVRCRHSTLVPWVQQLVDVVDAWVDAWTESPWQTLLYVVLWFMVARFVVRNRKVRMVWSVVALLCKVGLDLASVYWRRFKTSVRARRAVEFTGDPNQKVMRRPVMKAPLAKPRGAVPSGLASVPSGLASVPSGLASVPLPPGITLPPLAPVHEVVHEVAAREKTE